MKKTLLLIAVLFLLSAQVPLPQTVNPPNVPSGLDSHGNLTQRQIQFPLDLSFAAIYGQPTTSSTEAEINLGDVNLVLDTDYGFQNDYTVEITPVIDYGPMMIGTIKSIDTGSGQTVITVHVTRSIGGGIYNRWNIAVIGGPSVQVSTGTAFSGTSNGSAALGMKMTLGNPGAFPYSSGTIGVGTAMTFTVPAGQNFPVQGHLKVDDYVTPNNHYDVQTVAYSGTTLTTKVTAAYGTGSPSSAWRISRLVGPQSRIPPYSISGLQISQSSNTATLNIAAGCVRDSGDQVDLCLSAATTIDLSNSANIVSVQGPGTVTSFGGGTTALVGSSSTFTTSFSSSGTLTDLTNQTTALRLTAITARSLIWDGVSVLTNISAIANNTHATLGQAVTGATGTYYRGGPISHTGCLNLECDFGIILARQDSTGTVKPFGVSFTVSGAVDLPSGYTYYRIIAAAGLYWDGSQYVLSLLNQPLMAMQIGQLVNGITLPFLGSIVPAGYVLGAGALPSPTLNAIPFNATGTAAQSFLVNNNGSVAFVPGSYGLPISSISGRPAVSLSTATNVLSGDVSLNNVSNYFDGPSMAQGTTGTWWASGTVTVTDTAGIAAINCKLWDGTTVISSGRQGISAASRSETLALSGFLASPAGNIRISCNDPTSTSGKIQFNASGNSADANIFGQRIQ